MKWLIFGGVAVLGLWVLGMCKAAGRGREIDETMKRRER